MSLNHHERLDTLLYLMGFNARELQVRSEPQRGALTSCARGTARPRSGPSSRSPAGRAHAFAFSARIAFVDSSFTLGSATFPPQSVLSIASRPPGRKSARQRS